MDEFTLADEIAKYSVPLYSETDRRFATQFACGTIKLVDTWFADYDHVKALGIPYNHVDLCFRPEGDFTHACSLTFTDWHSRYYGKGNC